MSDKPSRRSRFSKYLHRTPKPPKGQTASPASGIAIPVHAPLPVAASSSSSNTALPLAVKPASTTAALSSPAPPPSATALSSPAPVLSSTTPGVSSPTSSSTTSAPFSTVSVPSSATPLLSSTSPSSATPLLSATTPALSSPTPVLPTTTSVPSSPASVPPSTTPTPSSPSPAPAPTSPAPITPAPLPLGRDLWTEAIEKGSDKAKRWMAKNECGQLDPRPAKIKIQELVDLAKAKESHCEEHPWAITIGNQKIIFRDYVVDFVQCITMLGDAVIPFAPSEVSAPWSVVKAVMKIPVMQAEQICALLGTVEVIVRIIRRGQVYEALYTTNTVENDAAFENFQGSLLKVYSAAIELLAESDALFSKGMARQTFHAIVHPSKGKGLASDLFKAEQKLALDIQPCEAICRRKNDKSTNSKIDNLQKLLLQLDPQLTRVDNTVNKLLEKLEEAEQDKLLEFISPVPFGDVLDKVKGSRTVGTGEWLLAHAGFREWECIRSSSTLLLLEGNSGTGKTYLTSRVIQYISEKLEGSPNHEGFAYFYCQKGPSLMDPCTALRSFVRQLSYVANDFDSIQKNVIKECKISKQKGSSGLSYDTCKDLIIKSINLYPKTTLILDAFDESDSSNKNLIDTLIEIMDESTRPVKVFVSSRTGREITKLFEKTPTITINAKNDTDVNILLDEVYNEGWYKKLSIENPSLQLEISETFASRSLGMIRWVYLQVNRLRRCTTHGSIKETLKTLPKDLIESYDLSYNEIRQNGDTDLALAERAIKWVMVSYHALGADALLDAVRVMPQGMELEGGTRQRILTLCEDFLTLDKQRNVWELSHTSVGEYFESKHWSGEVANLFVAQASLTLLNDAYILVDAEALDEYVLKKMRFDRPKNRQPRRNDITAILVYASHHWPLHVKRYEAGLNPSMEANAELSQLLKRFLGSPGFSSRQYRMWAKFMTMSRYMPPSYPKSSPFIKIHHDAFTPTNVALFIMCHFGLYYLLVDWWMGDSINGACTKTTRSGYNALSCAARGGSRPICERLVTKIDVNFPLGNDVYCTVLIDAIAHDQVEIAEFLIESAGATVEASSWGRYGSALAAAAAHSPLTFVEWLTKSGHVHIDLLTETSSPNSPLEKAIWHGRTEIVHYLLKQGAAANALFPEGIVKSALAAAAYGGGPKTDMIEDLIRHGAVPDLPIPGEYASALACAAYFGKIENMDALITGGAKVNLRLSTGDYGSALAAAACGLNNADATRWLISKKADVNQDLGTYGSALVASLCFQKDNMKDSTMILLEAGAMGSAVLPEGPYSSGLAAAAFWGHVDLLKHMVERETPSVALESLRHSRTPSTSVLDYKMMRHQPGFITESQMLDRERAALYLVQELGLDTKILSQLGLDMPQGL